MLKLEGISKVYNPGEITEVCLFRDFDLHIKKGEFVAVVGSNGSGKTSLLNMICGTIPIEKGRIEIAGINIAKQKEFQRYQTIGRVYQNPALGNCSQLTLLENMSLADHKGKRFGLTSGINHRRAEYYKEQLSTLGLQLENKLDVKLGALSGGQRQAVALIMATLTPIDILILDEHTAALDPKTAETIMRITDQIVREKNLTTLMVTHNLRYAVEYGDRLLMMHKGKVIMDKTEKEKQQVDVNALLGVFTEISIECGN